MQQQIERDLKAALLAGDKLTSETLKGAKNALQYEAVAKSVKPDELDQQVCISVLARESKKRQEAADLYKRAGETERAQKELAEKAIIDKYLPKQLSEEELTNLVDAEIKALASPNINDMGKVIGAVRAKTAGAADGALIARLAKERLGEAEK